MTANERLEALLNRAGQTISDLPKNHCGLIGRVANLVDVIDRMETALENVIGERDWLRERVRLGAACETCVNHLDGDPLQCRDHALCVLAEDNGCVTYEYSGVPEDWKADDAETQ